MKQYETNLTNAIVQDIEPGNRYYVNVFAVFKTSKDLEDEIVPYEPMELYIEPETGYSAKSTIIVLGGIMLVGALYFAVKTMCKKEKKYYKEKGPSKHIEYELTSVKSKSGAGEYQRPIDLIKDIGETESLNTSTNSFGVGEPAKYGF
jgi:LPXTG-motif cell wall-anchored protein